ncbi:MAG TPA: cupin domain-containing protein [Gemmatimonadaceae bacterium]|nr:cupin domain-containing protein [Gemmatimonadaceae bacterium]
MSVQHQISGRALQLSLAEEQARVREELAADRTRSARTLIKNGPLRVTLIGLHGGGEMHEHRADGPITVQVLEGDIAFEAEGRRWPLAAGDLLALDAGVTHSVRSKSGGFFLLTVIAPGEGE